MPSSRPMPGWDRRTRYIRVRAENGPRFAQMLRDAGYWARWMGPGTARTQYAFGCGDPNCCEQHAAYFHPQAWGSIKTRATGKQAHKVWFPA